VLVGIIPERDLNNGLPSFLATLIANGGPRLGEHAVHIGAGVGYYTAIIARLVGRGGQVTAIEFDPDLAARTAANFAGQRNVRVVQGDGSQVVFDTAEIIFVNAGATRRPIPGSTGSPKRPTDPAADDEPSFQGSESIPIERRGAVFRIERHGDEFRRGGSRRWRSSRARACATPKPRPRSLRHSQGRAGEVTRLYRRETYRRRIAGARAGWCLAYA